MSISSPKKIIFKGRILLLGCGAVSRCFQPLLFRHFDMDFNKLTIIDFENCAEKIPNTIASGAKFVQQRITPENYSETLSKYLSSGDLLIDLAYNISTLDLINWCYRHNVLYINTAVEEWNPYEDAYQAPTAKTLYARHMRIRESVQKRTNGFGSVTSVVEHGANPGLVSHWVKQALEDMVMAMMKDMDPQSFYALELDHALQNNYFAMVAKLTGTKVIHIAERDSQITNVPKKVDEFVNTWSIEGFREEGIAPAEMGWGTHERKLPKFAQVHTSMPGNQICLAQMGINTWVRSWVPSGEITGMVVRHGEAFTMSDHLTVWRSDDAPEYRPTVHYAYMPCDAALVSLHEMKMSNYTLQKK